MANLFSYSNITRNTIIRICHTSVMILVAVVTVEEGTMVVGKVTAVIIV